MELCVSVSYLSVFASQLLKLHSLHHHALTTPPPPSQACTLLDNFFFLHLFSSGCLGGVHLSVQPFSHWVLSGWLRWVPGTVSESTSIAGVWLDVRLYKASSVVLFSAPALLLTLNLGFQGEQNVHP